LLAPITSPPVSGFITYGRLAAPSLHNEAESGSLALRLTGSPHEASPHGLLRLTLARLPVEWAINRVSSFQLTRSARLILALHTLPFMYTSIIKHLVRLPRQLVSIIAAAYLARFESAGAAERVDASSASIAIDAHLKLVARDELPQLSKNRLARVHGLPPKQREKQPYGGPERVKI